MRAKLTLTSILLVLLLSLPAAAQLNQIVTSADATWTHLSAARAINARGVVTLNAFLKSDGTVRSVTAQSGNVILRRSSELAVAQWKFNPKLAPGPVALSLDFEFVRLPEKIVEVGHGSEFDVQLSRLDQERILVTVAVTELVAKTILLPRVNGKIAEKKCDLHDHVMRTEIVEINYGLFGTLPGFEDLLEAEEQLFPNANFDVGGGCLIEVPERTEVYFCDRCREAYKKWAEQRRKDLNRQRDTEKTHG